MRSYYLQISMHFMEGMKRNEYCPFCKMDSNFICDNTVLVN